MSDPLYRMTLDLNVLNHLGLNLYSNVAAVLSEAVANAWDADASSVDIELGGTKKVITITDDGNGMSLADANERFLNVGYDRRKVSAKTDGGRTPMGRKGIGKLSLFSVAARVTVVSRKGDELHGFILDVADIQEVMKKGGTYFPKAVPKENLPPLTKGTKITLENLKSRATAATDKALRQRLARRFTFPGGVFAIKVDGKPIDIADRDDVRKLQFLWELEDADKIVAHHLVKRRRLSRQVSVDNKSYSVTGWIGSVSMPKQLDTVDGGNLNSIVVLARGRLIQENILDQVNAGGIYTKYLTGQIEADFLDLDDESDIATSDRQRIIEDDPRYLALVKFVADSLLILEKEWSQWRAELGTKQAEEKYPRLHEWLEGLPPASRANAKRVIGIVQGLKLDDHEEGQRLELLRQGVIAFERLRLKENSELLLKAISNKAEDILPLLGDHDQLEAALYLDIVRGRINIIKNFQGVVDNNEKEKVLQKYLFDHLWLLDPSWERAASTAHMEERVNKEFKAIDAALDDDEKAGRVDIKYRTTARKNVIIELKRASVVPSVMALVQQGHKYREATKKCLEAVQRGKEPIEIIFVLGPKGVKENEEAFVNKQLDSIGGRVITFDTLINGALESYGEYFKAQHKVDVIDKLFETPAAVGSQAPVAVVATGS